MEIVHDGIKWNREGTCRRCGQCCGSCQWLKPAIVAGTYKCTHPDYPNVKECGNTPEWPDKPDIVLQPDCGFSFREIGPIEEDPEDGNSDTIS